MHELFYLSASSRYLKARQAEWAEAAAAALAAVPDPECPPGHVKLAEEVRAGLVTQLAARHKQLLQENNRWTNNRAANKPSAKFIQSRRMPILGPLLIVESSY